ncbi:ead/Ea22-like family protein [Serratia marcescens]|nr:ead/Ea22-like family protein [Serratia marcescens]
MDKFSELKAAAMAATPGPWILDDDSWSEGDNANVSTEERYDGRIVSIAQIEGGGSESGFDEPFSAEQQANARYITAANPAVVLALLAERDSNQQNYQNAMEEMRIERSQRQAADQRIAELEAEITNIVDSHAETVAELRAKLATPVRLKKVDSSNVPYAGDGFNAAVDYCADRVRAAGFTVEGDE